MPLACTYCFLWSVPACICSYQWLNAEPSWVAAVLPLGHGCKGSPTDYHEIWQEYWDYDITCIQSRNVSIYDYILEIYGKSKNMELDRFAPTLGQNGTPCAILPPNGMFDMQRFCYLICQSTWCQNASKLIYQKGEISFLWDTKNVVYCKFDFHAWRWIGRWQKSSGLENRPTPGMFFPKHPVFHFAPMFHFAPTYYIACILWGVDACVFLLIYV